MSPSDREPVEGPGSVGVDALAEARRLLREPRYEVRDNDTLWSIDSPTAIAYALIAIAERMPVELGGELCTFASCIWRGRVHAGKHQLRSTQAAADAGGE